MRRVPVLMTVVALLAAASGYMVAMLFSGGLTQPAPAGGAAAQAPDDVVGQRRPDFSLVDATGQAVGAAAFDGNVLLVNFWASWCAPCVEEMPMLSEFQQAHAGQGVEVVGIALDDPDRAAAFAAELKPRYTLLFGLQDAMLAARLFGNRSGMLPYSVLVDTGGTIQWTRLGAVGREELESQLAALPTGARP